MCMSPRVVFTSSYVGQGLATDCELSAKEFCRHAGRSDESTDSSIGLAPFFSKIKRLDFYAGQKKTM